MGKIRCRFAPAPTGHLHIGGARTALFNWLFARGTGGVFVLRIEDTDVDRNDPEAVEGILRSLQWLGIDWDEGPYFQSKRQDLYREHSQALLEKGLAYEEVSEKGTALRFRMPKEDRTFDDIVHGSITFPVSQMEDLVIMKSNGTPTYNFACAVDDHDMGISHVVRGDDHMANTPKQIAVYEAMEWDVPAFAHVPMIHGEDGSKLSKRHGAASAMEFKDEGYLPEAMVNFIALLGWSPGDDREVMSLDELVSVFSLERIKKTSAIFQRDKLDWMNCEHIKAAPKEEIAGKALEFLREKGIDVQGANMEWFQELVTVYEERLKNFSDLVTYAYFFFEDLRYDEDAVKKVLRKDGVADVLSGAADKLELCGEWTAEALESCVRDYAGEKDLKLGAVCQPIRVAVTGMKVSPGIFEVLVLLGKEKTIARIRSAVDMLSA